MKDEIRFGAPWALSVKIITIVVIGLLLGLPVIAAGKLPANTPVLARLATTILPPAILLCTLAFMVRGFVLTHSELVIERFGWCNHIPLNMVVSVNADADAMRGSIRLCGSGGVFGFFGWFRNRKLGVYRAYGTDPRLSVVVKLTNRTIVVTPDDPNRFVTEINARWEMG